MKYTTSKILCLSSWITNARLLIEYKAVVNGHVNLSGTVPIHYAIDFDNTKLLKLLIEKGASIDIKAFDGTNQSISQYFSELLQYFSAIIEKYCNIALVFCAIIEKYCNIAQYCALFLQYFSIIKKTRFEA